MAEYVAQNRRTGRARALPFWSATHRSLRRSPSLVVSCKRRKDDLDPGCYRWISWFDPAAKYNTSEECHSHHTFIANALLRIATAELQRDVRARWSGGNGGGRAGGHPAAYALRN